MTWLASVPAWYGDLTRQEAEAPQALGKAYPQGVSDEVLSAALTPISVRGHGSSLLPVVITRLRAKLPSGGVERIKHFGYRLTLEAAAQL